jgi:hypothetical protein
VNTRAAVLRKDPVEGGGVADLLEVFNVLQPEGNVAAELSEHSPEDHGDPLGEVVFDRFRQPHDA